MIALITGICGQDGSHLSELLLSKSYRVCGIDMLPDYWRLSELGIRDIVEIFPADITDLASLIHLVQKVKPDELYHLASQSFVGTSFDHPIAAALVTGVGTLNVLEAVRIAKQDCKIYNAATSELYGNTLEVPQNEDTPMHPTSPYAVSKLYAYNICRLYRKAYEMFITNGILFNHEGPLRGEEFVTRKISLAASRIRLGLQNKLELGNLDAQRDWGYAPEYVESMWKMMQHDKPLDLVIATGESHSVEEFCEASFNYCELDWEDYVIREPRFFRPVDVDKLRGDASRARKLLGWEPKVRFGELANIMVEADLKRLR